MGREARKLILTDLERLRDSRVLCYITGDRNPVASQIGDDALRPIYTELREIGHAKRIDLFLYSRGGASDVPWRIVTALRRAADEWNVLIPFRANSAATLIALGADAVILGAQGELGPIDPSVQINRIMPGPPGQQTAVQENISVEDVMAYLKFVRERSGLAEQAALTAANAELGKRVDAVSLGAMYRTHSHIRDVARRILLSRRQPAGAAVQETIIQRLAEQVYAHGHAISEGEAREIGVPVERAEERVDTLMWKLLEDYEEDLKLREPIDPHAVLANSDQYREEACIAVVESRASQHRFVGQIEISARRQLPPTLNATVQINLQLPDGAAQPNPMMMQQLGGLQQQVTQQAQQAIQKALREQAPLIGIEAGFRGGVWRRAD